MDRLDILADVHPRAGGELTEVTPVNGGVQTRIRITIEVEGGTKPACVIDSLSRWLT